VTLELDAVELRVLGCLIEKERSTPQNYPLTLNALRLACNQSTNRFPVTDYDEQILDGTVTGLKDKGLLRFVYSTSNRATKYRHVLDEVLRLEPDEIAALAVLVLRGPQTLGEIKGRSDRLHAFGDLGEVQATLDRLASREDPMVLRLERRPGQKDARWVHLLGADPPAGRFTGDETAVTDEMILPRSDVQLDPPPGTDPAVHLSPHRSDYTAAAVPSPRVPSDDRVAEERITELENEVHQLRGEVERLDQAIEALRAELGG